MDKLIQIKLPKEDHDQLKILAKDHGLKVTTFTKMLIAKAIKDNQTPTW